MTEEENVENGEVNDIAVEDPDDEADAPAEDAGGDE